MAWVDKVEEEKYEDILQKWSYEEKMLLHIVDGPRRWLPPERGLKRQITEEMRTWEKHTFAEILVSVKPEEWKPIVLGCPADSMFSSAFIEATNNKESLEASDYYILEIDKDSGICSIPLSSEGGYASHSMQPSTAWASYDVRNPRYNSQVNKPLTPGTIPKKVHFDI